MNKQNIVAPTALQNFMNSAIVSYGLKIIGAIVVIVILLLISKFIAGIVRRNMIKNADPEDKNIAKIGKLMGDITFYILVIFSFFIGFEIVGFNVGLILGGISFGVGLAFKQILGNIIAGIMILYTKEFKLGDMVEVYADQKYFGRIEEITIRYTLIRTLDLRQVVLPNMTLISVPIKTYSSETFVKLSVLQRAEYETEPKKVIEVMLQAVNSMDFVRNKENTKVFINEWRDSYVEYKAFFDFDPNSGYGLLYEVAIAQVSQKIYEAFLENDIDCPYDVKTISFESREDQKKLQKEIEEKIKEQIEENTTKSEEIQAKSIT